MTINFPESTFFKRPKKRGPRKARTGKRASPEHTLQVQVANALEQHCKHVWFAVENGGKRHIRAAQKLKRAGVRPGVPDLHFCLPRGQAAYLELKAEKGRLSEAQIKFRQDVQALQGWWAVAYSFDEAWGILAAWGCLPSEANR